MRWGANENDEIMTIPELTTQLNRMSAQLETGKLTANEILEMSDLSRKLYEQVVVLRHKTFENGLADAAPTTRPTPDDTAREHDTSQTPTSSPEITADARDEMEESTPSPEINYYKRMDDRDETEEEEEDNQSAAEPPAAPTAEPPKPKSRGWSNAQVPPNQISLIDSIEEIQRMEKSLNDKYSDGESPSLGDRLKKQPIHDLRSAMGINRKFRFINVLFKDNREAFDRAIENLNTCASWDEAEKYMRESLKSRFDWDEDNPEVLELTDLVERRYL